MNTLEWDEHYSVENAELDEQHKNLFMMINALFHARASKAESKIIPALLEGIKACAALHFQAEEDYMARCDYQGLEYHKKEHAKFLEKVSLFRSGDTGDPLIIITAIVGYLHDWLTNHVLQQDSDYIQHIKSVDSYKAVV